MTRNLDTEGADRCQLPKLVPGICNRCRDYRYCYRQLSFEDILNDEDLNDEERKEE